MTNVALNHMEPQHQKLTIIQDDTIPKPWCKHGPTLLFQRTLQEQTIKFFACAACRNRQECSFYKEYNESSAEDAVDHSKDIAYDDSNLVSFEQFQKTDPSQRYYCKSCHCVFIKTLNGKSKHSTHDIILLRNRTHPSEILPPKSNDKKEAQYFFSKETLEFFRNLLKKLNINKVLCIGAPALHDHLLKSSFDSFLLDIDERLLSFYPPEIFALYNMFNHHFFMGSKPKRSYKNFLKLGDDEKLCIFTDPPFGCRTEPLVDTLKKITGDYRNTNGDSTAIVPVIWVFPYFMENYIQKVMPELSMCDYKINYTNHKTYNETSKARKDMGSPIRFFTNIFPEYIELPKENYNFCKKCKRFVDKWNLHCNLCGTCPSKNGSTYRHCKLCHLCVKPTYRHCMNCKKCAQIEGHNCSTYRKQITCYICYKKGHAESDCDLFKKLHKNFDRQKVNCLICLRNGHTHMTCPNREAFLSNFELNK